MKQGQHQLRCQGTAIQDILNKHRPIDVIKIDCEGGEEHLLGMTEKEIRSVPYWIIETHSLHLHQAIIKKFCENDFSIAYDSALAPSVNLLHFIKDRNHGPKL
jgi:Methyltransferase FkbM domain